MQEDMSSIIRLMTRRRFLTAMRRAGRVVGACRLHDRAAGHAICARAAPPASTRAASADYATMYGPMDDEGFELPAVPYQKIDPQFLRQIVPDPTGEPPGTIVVDTSAHLLYLVLRRRHGDALRRRAWPRRLRVVGRRGRPVEAEMAEMDAAGRDDRAPARSSKIQRRQWRHAAAASTIRSARARSTCSRTTRTRSTGCTARRNGIRSASRCRRAACG